MKEFFEQGLRDLEPLTGKRQLAYWEMEAGSDLKEAQRKRDVCIAGMIAASARFPYIPEDEQKKIIREAMETDQEYEALNSRVIWKWLNLHKDLYWGKAQRAQITEQELTPAPPEVADKYAEEWKKELEKVGNPQVIIDRKKLREEAGLVSQTSGITSTTEQELILNQKRIEWSRKYHHLDRLPPNNKKDDWISFDEYLIYALNEGEKG